jgi:hypothetical protein
MTKLDFMGYEIVADGVDAGRYATAEVAAQAEADELYGYISDASKDVNGCRFRMDISGMTFAELEAECDFWSNLVEQEIAAEKAYEEESLNAFIQYAPDMETAERWLEEACNA